MTTTSVNGEAADDDDSFRSYCSPATINGQRVMIAAYEHKNPVVLVFDHYGHVFLWLTEKPTKEQLGQVLLGIAETDAWTTEDPFLNTQPLLEDFDAIEEPYEFAVFVPQDKLLAVDVVRLRRAMEDLRLYEMEG